MRRSGLSHAASLILALIVTAAAAGVAIAGYALSSQGAVAAALGEGGLWVKLSLIHI